MPVAVPIAMVVAAGISAVAAKYNADQQSSAAGNALGAQEKATQSAYNTVQQARDQAQQDVQPWSNAGKTALSALAQPQNQNFTFSTTGPNADPSYQFRQQEGQAAIEASAAARGGYFSGATGTALQTQGQNMASEEYGAEYNRWLQNNQQLEQQAQMGLQAQGLATGLGYNAGNTLAGLSLSSGQNQANTLQNQAGYQAGAVQNLAGVGNSLLSYYAMQNMTGNNQNSGVSNNLDAQLAQNQNNINQNNSMIDNMQAPSLWGQ